MDQAAFEGKENIAAGAVPASGFKQNAYGAVDLQKRLVPLAVTSTSTRSLTFHLSPRECGNWEFSTVKMSHMSL